MRDNKTIAIVAGAVSLGSASAIVMALVGGFGPRIDPAPYRAVGDALARQTLALVKPGGRVTVITRDTQTFQNPATDLQFAALRKDLAKAGVRIDSIQSIQVDPLRPLAVPAGDFLQWIKHSSKGDVIVSLMGPPIFSDAQLSQLDEIKPAIIAFCSGPIRDQVDLRSLFSRGLLQAAVVSKRPAEIKSAPSAGEREIFDRQFVEITAGNLTALSTVSNGSP
jgi:hypothetical protein